MSTECFLENLKEEHLGNLHIATDTKIPVMTYDWTVFAKKVQCSVLAQLNNCQVFQGFSLSHTHARMHTRTHE
jgi:hypothetical protein